MKGNTGDNLVQQICDMLSGKKSVKEWLDSLPTDKKLIHEPKMAFWEKVVEILPPSYFSRKTHGEFLREYFARAVAQYVLICIEQNINEWESGPYFQEVESTKPITFLNVIENSKSFYKKLYNRRMSMALEGLIRVWDAMLAERHDVTPDHCVLLASSNGHQGKSLMFYDDAKPDTRLIIIYVTDYGSPKERLMLCLHELGHFIGCRNRDVRSELYSRMCALSYMEEVYRKSWASILRIHEDYVTPRIAEDTKYSFALRLEMYASRKILENYACELSTDLAKPISNLHEHYLKQMHDSVVTYMTNSQDSIVDRLKQKLTNDGRVQEYACKILCDVAKKVINESETNEIENNYSQAKPITEKPTAAQLLQVYVVPCAFMERVDSWFSEIAADVFMAQISGVRTQKEYLQLVLTETERCWLSRIKIRGLKMNESCVAAISRFAVSDLLRIRVVAVLQSLPNSNIYEAGTSDLTQKIASDYHEYYIKYVASLPQVERCTSCDTIGALEYSFIPQLDVWNPQRAFSAYAHVIYSDIVYTNTCFVTKRKEKTHANDTSDKERDIRIAVLRLRSFMTETVWEWHLNRVKNWFVRWWKKIFGNQMGA